MNTAVQKYKVSLGGHVYSFVSDEPEAIFLQTVALVDGLMKEIAQQTRCNDDRRLALLAALHLAQQQLSSQSKALSEHSKLLSLIDGEL